MNSISKILTNFLNIYWIRPETAIWRTLDVLQMQKINFEKPMLDAGCGDGSFSFTHFSGETDKAFDVYKTIESTKEFFRGKDIHNQSTTIKPKIIKKSTKKIDVGLDWKKNLLKKASEFRCYNKIIQHNLNKPFPFDDKTFETIFSNVYYWLEDPKSVLKETNRILTDNGKVIILLPDARFKKYLIYNKFLKNGYNWAKILDRGIHNNIKHCYSFSKWKSMFNDSSLQIENHSTYLSKTMIKFWSVGLRPYSPYIIDMANKLNSKDRIRIKTRLIKELLPVFRSFIESELQSQNNQNCFHMFVLKKKINYNK